ncbi:MAG: SPASM domain-containing protein [Candidatus Riflebacteria bacterium]|nr:SPASM domain-containing protein [Candidatus Riflebacteria bacterium]
MAGLTRRGAEVRVSLAGPTAATCDGVSRATRFDVAVRGVNQLLGLGGSAIVDLMLVPQHADEVVARFGELRSRFPRGTKITLGLLYVSGRETGEHMFESRSRLEELLDRVAFEAGEAIAAPRRSPLADRREACTCALGHHLHVRSDGALFTCFKMEEQVGHLGQTGFSRTVEMVRAAPRPARSLRFCAGCPLATLCGGGCRAENLQYTGDADVPVCGPWRLRVLSELLAEDRVTALEWPAVHLLTEARERGIDGPSRLVPALPSRHLLDT